MKLFLSTVIFFISIYTNAQNICIDSSTHIQYQPLLNDFFHIEKTIQTKDSGKVSIGFFENGAVNDRPFIYRMNKAGEVVWFKKITAPFGNGSAGLEAIEEAANGNIFVTTKTKQSDNRPYFYLVFNPAGDLIYQNKIGFKNIFDLGNRSISSPVLSKLGQDSVLIGFTAHPGNGEGEILTLITTDNNGNIGQAYTFEAPLVSIFESYFREWKISGDMIDLYGSAHHASGCTVLGGYEPVFIHLRINWNTKQVISKKAYCAPLYASLSVHPDILGESFERNNCRQSIFFLANGNIVMTRRSMGLDLMGVDTVNKLFSISEFDADLNHIKSDFLIAKKPFKQNCYYDLFIDSSNNRYVRVHDQLNKRLYYSKINSTNSFSYQKYIPFSAPKWNNARNPISFLEPGDFTSFFILSSDNQRSYIDNWKILATDTAAACFGTTTDLLTTKPASLSLINWQGNYTVQQADLEEAPTSFTQEDYPLQRTIICNIVHRCDTIKINAPDTVCNISQPVTITAHKNPLCSGKINFTFDPTFVSASQQINDTTITLTLKKSGTLKIYAQPSGCDKLIDSVEMVIIAPPQLLFGNDTIYCPGKTYTLDAYDPGFISYQWQDGTTESIYVATKDGKYYVTAVDACNREYSDTIVISKCNFNINLGPDTTICLNETLELSVPAGYLNYLWHPHNQVSNPAAQNVTISPKVNTTFAVEVEVIKGCMIRDTITVSVKTCPEYIYFPNSFTPNNDGINDSFKPRTGGVFEKYELQVYNRWGQRVFSTSNRNEGWNGKYKDNLQGDGTFIWLCRYKFYNKPEKVQKGLVSLFK